ncbi:hypothetical protein [Quadrisphaera setariae]|uniref:Uncharacterized protein n=1 Tax=Quadrisphaera setariae TaxID=2593304 RepID=A0A5C8ZGR1_9ACTN|nr:hypothetical protein [Quadrisphaera setariae]TXR56351.1 hypothetical protein FMM08_09595 [Quadrisphaera setariae]
MASTPAVDDGDAEGGPDTAPAPEAAEPAPGAAEPVVDALAQDPSDVAVHRGCQAVWGGTTDCAGLGTWGGADEGVRAGVLEGGVDEGGP